MGVQVKGVEASVRRCRPRRVEWIFCVEGDAVWKAPQCARYTRTEHHALAASVQGIRVNRRRGCEGG